MQPNPTQYTLLNLDTLLVITIPREKLIKRLHDHYQTIISQLAVDELENNPEIEKCLNVAIQNTRVHLDEYVRLITSEQLPMALLAKFNNLSNVSLHLKKRILLDLHMEFVHLNQRCPTDIPKPLLQVIQFT